MRPSRFLIAACSLCLLTGVRSALAAGPKPVQLAFFSPVQLVPEKEDVSGLRLNLIYGVNQNVTGVDWGFVNHTRGDGFAWQAGGVGLVEKNFTGWQDNWINVTRGEFTGLQSGVFNQAEKGNGVQFGFVNVTKSMHGLQLGLLNMTDTLHGLQVGVGNVISKGKIPFLPIVNWSM
jgi:hypothetical protein